MLTSQDGNKESGQKYVNIYHHLAYSLLQLLSKLLVPTGGSMCSKIFMDKCCGKKKSTITISLYTYVSTNYHEKSDGRSIVLRKIRTGL